MAGSRKWVAAVADALVKTIGRELALSVVRVIRDVPGANLEARLTLEMLEMELRKP